MNWVGWSGNTRAQPGLPLAIFGLSSCVLWLRGRAIPARSSNPDWQLGLERATGCVRAISQHAASLAESSVCGGIGNRPLLPLLGAWSKLSIGRIGILEPIVSERLPWLFFGALAPMFVFALVRRVQGTRTAALAAAWLLALPGFTAGVATAQPEALLACSWLLALAPYAAWLAAREPNARNYALGLLALGSLAAVGFVLAAAWVVPLMALHYALTRGKLAQRMMRSGHLPLPTAAFVCGVGVVCACVLFDPNLWHSDPPKTIVALFAAPAGPTASPRRVPELTPWIAVVALAGALAFAWRALGRRFATGELRPARDPSGTSELIACGLVLSWWLAGTSGALPFLAMLAAIGASALSQLLVRER
ncbi:MAG TPA: glycosyltransferase family 39 protein, partial [Polyangiaceae bacterium]